jgi:hypothetical protein
VNKELYLRWSTRFLEAAIHNGCPRILPLLDGHSTHTKNIEALQLGYNSDIIIIFLPAHASYLLQPLYVAFLRHWSLCCTEEIEMWLRDRSGDASVG